MTEITPDLIPETTASEAFRITPAVYVKHSLAVPGILWPSVFGPVVIILGLAVIGVIQSDVRFFMIALMVLFIAFPIMLTMLYFSKALSPGATRATLPHTVRILKGGSVEIKYLPPDDDEPRRYTPWPETFHPSSFTSVKVSSSFIIYQLKDRRLIIIPQKILNLKPGWHCQFRDFD